MTIKNFKIRLLAVSFAAVFLAGCSNFNGLAIRKSHTENYQRQLIEKTNEILSEKQSFGLDDCIEVALANNLNVRSSKVRQKIAELEKKVSFSNFLPTVNLDYQHTRWDRQPKIKNGSAASATHDQGIRELTWRIQMNIFNPSTWMMYAMHQRGQEVAELVTRYTKQLTVLEVTINYYHCLSLMQTEFALQSQLDVALSLEKDIRAFYQEGMVTQWQAEKAEAIVLDKETALSSVQDAIRQAKADLLVSLGLSPLAEILLRTEQPLPISDEPLEGIVAEMLISNPQLYIADRKIAIEKEKVKIALAGFLPKLTGFVNLTNSSDSFLLYDNFWTYGLAGTMSIFNGFATINEYKAAKQRKTEAFVEREQQTLVLILEVVKAYLNSEDAKRQLLLSQKNFDVSSMHFDEVYEKWREGLLDSSEMLKVMAEKDITQMELANSQFQLQVSAATLYHVMGVTDVSCQKDKDESNAKKDN